MAQDLHDHVAGTLMAMLLDLTHFQQTAGDPQLKRTFEDLEWQAREALREIRQIVYDLDRGRQLTNGLAARITEYLRHSTIATDISVALDVAPDWPSAVSVDFARAVFSIITQAVNNVRLHSGAQSATVRLAVDDEHALIEIKDDGVGIHVLPKKALGAKGLNSMKQRARGAGGTLEIVDLPHDGSAIRARIPFRITS